MITIDDGRRQWLEEVGDGGWRCALNFNRPTMGQNQSQIWAKMSTGYKQYNKCQKKVGQLWAKIRSTTMGWNRPEFCWYSFQYGDVLPCDLLPFLIFTLLVICKIINGSSARGGADHTPTPMPKSVQNYLFFWRVSIISEYRESACQKYLT